MPKAGMCEIDCHRPFSRQPLQPAALFAATLLGRDALDGVLIGGALPGILTTAGRREAFELGGALRARYVGNGDAKLLPDTWEKARRLVSFSPDEIRTCREQKRKRWHISRILSVIGKVGCGIWEAWVVVREIFWSRARWHNARDSAPRAASTPPV